jgi:hypothetical protein
MIRQQSYTISETAVSERMRQLYRYAQSITGVLQECIIWVVVALSEYMALVKKNY